MYYKAIINIFFIFILTVFQLSFISALPRYLSDLNLILVSLVFILGLRGMNSAMWWAVVAGIFLDIFSFYPFGVFLISLSVSAAAVNLLLTNFFTNRSLYSFLGLTVFFTLFYNFMLNIFFYFLPSANMETDLFIFNEKFWVNLFARIVLNLIAAWVVFHIINFASNRLKPAFLVKIKKS